MQLSLEFSNARFGQIPVGILQILSDPSHFGKIWLDQLPNPSKFSWIPTIFARSSRLLTMARIQQYSCQFQLESSLLTSGNGGRMSPDSKSGKIPGIGCCRNLTQAGFQRSIITEF